MESDIRRMLEEAAGPAGPAPDIGSIITRGRRRRRSQRAIGVGLSVVLVTAVGVGVARVTEAVRDARAPVAGGIARPPEREGIVVAATEAGDREPALYVLDPEGGGHSLLLEGPAGGVMAPAWSADGTLVAFAMNVAPGDDPDTVDTNMEIFVVRSDGTGLRRLTDHPGLDTNPAWSPDGSRIAFTRWPDGAASEGGSRVAIWAVNADGSNLERLTLGPGLADHADWSPNGEEIAFSKYVKSKDAYAIFTMEARAEDVRRFHVVTNAPRGVSNTSPAWSPDGSRIAFIRDGDQNRSGDSELYVVDSGGAHLRRVTTGGGSYYDPTWAPDGRGLAFIDGNRIRVIGPNTPERTLGSGYSEISGIDWRP